MNLTSSQNTPTTDKKLYLKTFTGKLFNPIDPQPEDIDIEDIAHALGNMCRYGGHCKTFYSVAEHSFNVSVLLEDTYPLCGLLHDASEAYIVDIPRPVKKYLSDYNAIEEKIMLVIADKFGFSWPMPETVKYVDDNIILDEKLALFDGYDHEPKFSVRVDCWTPEKAKVNFLRRFEVLNG